MAGLDDVTKKAQEFLNSNQVKDALKSEKAEDVSDKLLDGVAGIANTATGGKYEQQIDDARDSADKHVGNE